MDSSPARIVASAASVLLALTLVACAPEPDDSATFGPTPSDTPTPIVTLTPDATPTPLAQIPEDCRSMLTESVLSQLEDVPLNDPEAGVSTGPRPDGSLVCLWRDPGADTTFLQTTISGLARGPALDLLNGLADEQDFTCYTPEGGTRCEKTWENETYPVTDGRTLFWRDGILIDTTFSNLAPSGYTSAIIAGIWG